MKQRRTRLVAVVALAMAIVLIGAAAVWALPALQGTSSEANTIEQAPTGGAAVAIVGPDVEGYSGPPAPAGEFIEASEPGGVSRVAVAQAPDAPQPDEDGYEGPPPVSEQVVESSETGEGASATAFSIPDNAPDGEIAGAASTPDWSSFKYIFIAGSGLTPRDSDTPWSYHGLGCVSSSAVGDSFNMHIDLPSGSRIDFLRLYYYDTAAGDSRAWVTSYDGEGGWSDIATIESAGTAGYGSALSPYAGHIVDHTNNAYVVSWRPTVLAATMRLCGLRIAYRLPS